MRQSYKLKEFPESVKRNLAYLDEKSVSYQIKYFEEPAHRADDAADLLRCQLGEIVKSLVFLMEGKDLLLVLVSGENRVDLKHLKAHTGKEISQAKPADVKRLTGYAVGSVPPFGIPGEFPVLIDEDLFNYPSLWAAAGSPHILIRLSPVDLQQLSGGRVLAVKKN
jgi:Cys-tRNA(Pro) deacylase